MALRYKLDTTFLHLPASEVLAKLQANLDKLRARKDALEAEEEEIAEQMKELKALLYAKFGCKSGDYMKWEGAEAGPRADNVRVCVAQRASTLRGK